MTWFSKYRFTLTHTSAGARVVVPVIDDLIVEGKQESRFVWRKQIQGKFAFVGADFQYLYGIETGADRCERVDVLIEVKCDGVWGTFYSGYLKMNDGEWDPDKCRVLIPVSIDDEYSCFMENWNEEVNILSGTTKQTAGVLVGDLEAITCEDLAYIGPTSPIFTDISAVDNCISPGEGWVILRVYYFQPSGPDTARTTWVREKVTGSVSEPFGDGWIDLGGGDWAREPVLSDDYTTSIQSDFPADFEFEAFKQVRGAYIVHDQTGGVEAQGYTELSAGAEGGYLWWKAVTFDNAVRLEDVFLALDPCDGDYIFRSDFFRVNAGALPATDPYTAAQSGFEEILVWQKSDIVRPDADYNATRGTLTLKKLLGYLKNIFNTEFRITGTDIVIEHISYFEGTEGLDLTIPPYDADIEKKNRYSYTNAAKPKYERFKWMDAVTPYFTGSPIIYDNVCANNEDGSEVIYNADEISTDIGYMYDNEDEISLQGFSFGAAFEDGGGDYYLGISNLYVNGHLSWTELHDNYWRYSRPQLSGNMNNANETFESSVPSKQQEELAIPMTCNAFAAFNPEERVKSEIGWGEVSAWTYSAKKCLLTLQLLHS